MFGLNNLFPFSYFFMWLSFFIIVFSLIIMSILLFIENKLIYWIENYDDDFTLQEDKFDLIRAEKGIRNTIFCLWMGIFMYILMYIIQ